MNISLYGKLNFRKYKFDQERSRKILKYIDLIIEIQDTRIVKAEVVRLIIGETGTIQNVLRQVLM